MTQHEYRLRPLPKEAQFQSPYHAPDPLHPLFTSVQGVSPPQAQRKPRRQSQVPEPAPKRHQLTYLGVLQGGPVATSNNPPWARPKQPLPNERVQSVFPIIYSQPGTPLIESYLVKYLDKNNRMRTDCLPENVARQIPAHRIFSSTFLESGNYAHPCPQQEASNYRVWPF